MRELFLQAKNGSIMTQLNLKPIEDQQIRELNMAESHIRTF